MLKAKASAVICQLGQKVAKNGIKNRLNNRHDNPDPKEDKFLALFTRPNQESVNNAELAVAIIPHA